MEQQSTHQDDLTSLSVLKNEKICATKNRIKNKHKKDILQKYKDQNQKLSTPMNLQLTQNALTHQQLKKIVAVYFLVVKTEERFSSQDQKLVETTNL